ncbi:phage tail protein [Hahella sp. KA22]|uniref:phage tail protein n=1 Tax=Hahella sp. KA22 TaxID=1628392 RepID=UPI000FDD5B40|nr:tail fiber protein [Hahella sp. KA22]AZZ94469.1 phage tail protein [Hahella sp. KA22]QAY57842.1 phage tail protein [Hahella sp. KA22]
MAESFLGEVRIFAGYYVPQQWSFCNGQILTIQQNTALFSLLGATYGGDARTTFGLPDMRGRLPLGSGQGPGLTDRPIGNPTGTETVMLEPSNIPAHIHGLNASNDAITVDVDPTDQVTGVTAISFYAPPTPGAMTSLAPGSIGNTGGYQGNTLPHNNVMPYLALNFIISMMGYYPPKN